MEQQKSKTSQDEPPQELCADQVYSPEDLSLSSFAFERFASDVRVLVF
jgi:hypothetical protein